MANKAYEVYFATASVGRNGEALARHIAELSATHGENLPVVDIGGNHHQIRQLQQVGRVWKGEFAKLSDDAPHIVHEDDTESEIPLEDGDRILDKCHFLYREQSNVLVWQLRKNAGGLGRAAEYLSRLLDLTVTLPMVMNEAELEQILAGDVREISFDYSRPNVQETNAPNWDQATFNKMAAIGAAEAKFLMRAPRGHQFTEAAKAWIRILLGNNSTEKIRIKLTDDSDPIELFTAPLRDSMTVALQGSYPDPADVYRELEAAYDRCRALIPTAP